MPGGGIGNPCGRGLVCHHVTRIQAEGNCQHQLNKIQTNLTSEVWTYPGGKPGTPGTPGKESGGGAPGNTPGGGAPPGGMKGAGGAPGTIPGGGDIPVGSAGMTGMGGAAYA